MVAKDASQTMSDKREEELQGLLDANKDRGLFGRIQSAVMGSGFYDNLEKANEAHKEGKGVDYQYHAARATSAARRMGLDLNQPQEDKPQLSAEQLEQKQARILEVKNELEGKYKAYQEVRENRSVLQKFNPVNRFNSAKALDRIAEVNDMLKGDPSEVNINDAKIGLSLFEASIEKMGVDLEEFNAKADTFSQQLKDEESLEKAEEGLSPKEEYRKALEEELEVVGLEEVGGKYRVTVRQSLAEQDLIDEGHPELVENPELEPMDKISIATEVTAEKLGVDAPELPEEGLTKDNVQEYTNSVSQNFAEHSVGNVEMSLSIEGQSLGEDDGINR